MWEQTFGGEQFDTGVAIIQDDWDHLILGGTESDEGGPMVPWLLKIDHLEEKQWEESYTGNGDREYGFQYPKLSHGAATKTDDDGYMFAATSKSSESEVAWIVKVDDEGNKHWGKSYGDGHAVAWSLISTIDRRYLFAGEAESSEDERTEAWLVKIDGDGVKQWEETYSGDVDASAWSVIETSDWGYLALGGKQQNRGGPMAPWLLKIDQAGGKQWEETYGAPRGEFAKTVLQTRDDGYLICGYTTHTSGRSNAWLKKVDQRGAEEWHRTYDESEMNRALSLTTARNGFLLAGDASPGVDGPSDACLMKVDENGTEQWEATYGGSKDDVALSVVKTRDLGHLFAGRTNSGGTDSTDAWLVKVGGGAAVDYVRVSKIEFEPPDPSVNDPVTLRVHDSEPEKSYRWDLDNDGQPDRTGQVIKHRFEERGEHTVALIVENDAGNEAVYESTVRVHSERFGSLKEEKRELAGFIDETSTADLEERQRIDPILVTYTGAVETERIPVETAEEGVERLQLGETVTRDAIVAVGSADPEWWQGPSHLAAKTAEPTLGTLVNFLLLKSALARKIKAKLDRFVSVVESALDRLETGLSRLARLMAGASTAAEYAGMTRTRDVADDIYERVDQGALSTVEAVDEAIDDALDPVVDAVAVALQRYVEQATPIYGADAGPTAGLNGSLTYLHDSLSVEAAEAGLQGDIDAARQAQEAAYETINDTATDTAWLLDRYQTLVDGLGTVETFVGMMEEISPESQTGELLGHIGDMIALVRDLVKILTDAIGTGAGVKALDGIAREQHRAIENVVGGRSPDT